MQVLITLLLIYVISYGSCNYLYGIYINTGGCPNYTPARNLDLDSLSTVWTTYGRSRISTSDTRLDCTRFSFILNNNDKSEVALYVRTRGTDVIHGYQATLGFAISSHLGYYNILNTLGITQFFLKGSIWILDTDNETYCIIVMCNSQLSIGASYVYVLIRGIAPDNIIQITNAVLHENKLNPNGLIWGLDRNC